MLVLLALQTDCVIESIVGLRDGRGKILLPRLNLVFGSGHRALDSAVARMGRRR